MTTTRRISRAATAMLAVSASALVALSVAVFTPILLVSSASCLADDTSAGKHWAVGVHFENDLFADTDSQYTNGVKVTAISPDLTSLFSQRDDLPAWLRDLLPLDELPFDEDGGVARTFAFLHGSTWRDSHGVDHRPFVADLMVGITMSYSGLKVSLARVLRTREFRGQRVDHRFGSVTVSYAF